MAISNEIRNQETKSLWRGGDRPLTYEPAIIRLSCPSGQEVRGENQWVSSCKRKYLPRRPQSAVYRSEKYSVIRGYGINIQHISRSSRINKNPTAGSLCYKMAAVPETKTHGEEWRKWNLSTGMRLLCEISSRKSQARITDMCAYIILRAEKAASTCERMNERIINEKPSSAATRNLERQRESTHAIRRGQGP